MTPQEIAASLIADVPRYYEDTLLLEADVLAALAAAIAAERAKVARLVEAGKALSKACEGEVEEVFLGEIGNELSKFRAAITEAGQ